MNDISASLENYPESKRTILMNEYKLTNVQPSPVDVRDHIANLPQVVRLPIEIDLKPYVYEVENQFTYSSCTANAGCSALELLYNKHKTPVDLSRFFLYYYTRKLGGMTGDVGAYPRDIGKALKTYGVCRELTWDYTSANLANEPTDEAKIEALQYKIESYEQLTGDKLQQIKNAVAQEIPVLLTMQIHEGLYRLGNNWKEHMWDYTTTAENPIKGSHEVLVIGYDDVSQRLLVENSWGPGWADGGYFGIPYELLTTNVIGELWILNPDFSLEHKNDTLPPDPESPKRFDKKLIIIAAIIFALVLISHFLM